ncbi:hypothetical protein PENNAL_c0033G03634 [Penicillium nalgiovense]|uniref:Epidermal growth factor receptor-like transmembrane-juxtamembrane segment domain-containing protein n=1 Tax=Penicillium nalgiovense TaxID=60175 RepID=A0A1V6Y7C1_PENNA|nr:hypothetical protein PENNAL_c0033G03634 [Penicillium nalgiovense]
MVSLALESIVPRDLNTCTGTKQWYVCTAGDFRGCCSSDPCTTGICPDDGDEDTLSLTTAGVIALLPSVTPRTSTGSSTSTLSESTTLSTDASSTASVTSTTTSAGSDTPTASETPPVSETLLVSQVSTSSDISTTTESPGVTALSSVLGANASPSSTPSNKPSAASSNKGAIIGGVVGGVAVLVICAILFFFCCRRKRKYGKREKGPTLASWYKHGFTRKDRATASEMKGPLSPSDSEAHNIALAIDSSSAGSPFTTDTTRANIILTPDLTLGSSATSLISHPPRKTPPVPPAQPHSNELFASVPPRQGFTPELPDTGFHRLRAELASHSQSELINVPIKQRQRQQNHIRSRTGPRAWESPSLASIPSSRESPARVNNSSGHSPSNSNGGSPGRNQGGRVVTADGVVLGANLDRYSNGMAIGESLAEEERGRRTERGETDHVMSFMQYGARLEGRGLRNGLEIASDNTSNPQGRGDSVSGSRPRLVQRSLEDEIAAAEGDVDVPPAYEAQEVAPGHDIKSPSGRMGKSPRGGV